MARNPDFQFLISKRSLLVRPLELELLQDRDDVDEEELEPARTGGLSRQWRYTTHDIWAELSLDGGWTVAYRVALDRYNYPVIGEIRLFPSESWRPNNYEGRWSAEVLGSRARAPRGGIKQKLLRSIPTRHHARVLSRAMTYYQEQHQSLRGRFSLGRNPNPYRSDAGPKTRHPGALPKTSSRGRPALPEIAYARVARAYVDAIERRSRSPAKDVARMLRTNERRIRGMIARARTRGLLTRAPSPGGYGGSLTEHARALLKKHAKKKTSPRRKKGGGN